MAVIKAISSKAPIGTVIKYVMREEKTDRKLLTGIGCQPETAENQMEVTKLLWHKTGGRTYKHFVQSFAPGESISPEEAHGIACELINDDPFFRNFEVLIVTHVDRDHIHNHIVVNSVNTFDGHKIKQSKADLQEMKDISDKICLEHNLSITEKGKQFDGEEREETSANRKETYQMLKKAETGNVESYVWNIANAALECRGEATSRENFIQMMQERGYEVDWKDNHKYVTFTDLGRELNGETKCKVRNNKLEKYFNVDFGKETMENEFTKNLRRSAEAERTAAAADRAGTEIYRTGSEAKRAEAAILGGGVDGEAGSREPGELETEKREFIPHETGIAARAGDFRIEAEEPESDESKFKLDPIQSGIRSEAEREREARWRETETRAKSAISGRGTDGETRGSKSGDQRLEEAGQRRSGSDHRSGRKERGTAGQVPGQLERQLDDRVSEEKAERERGSGRSR